MQVPGINGSLASPLTRLHVEAPVNAEKIRLAEEIDSWVLDIVWHSAGDEQADERILEGMIAYMPLFKQLLDTCTGLEMDLLAQRYAGFYRFANLLERLAQAIRDGAIRVPEDVPMPPGWAGTPAQPKKKRPPKPKPKRVPEQQQQIRRPISFLPAYTELILGELAQTGEQYATFAEAGSKPHVLDDELVDRAIRLYEEQLAFIPLHERQLNWWLYCSVTSTPGVFT